MLYKPAVFTVMLAVVAPVLQRSVPSLVAVSVVELPVQNAVAPAMVKAGFGLDLTNLLAVAIQLCVLYAVTVYAPLPTVIAAVVAPVLHI